MVVAYICKIPTTGEVEVGGSQFVVFLGKSERSYLEHKLKLKGLVAWLKW
jgi:hypothetical protein